jgi:hypothetical protein
VVDRPLGATAEALSHVWARDGRRAQGGGGGVIRDKIIQSENPRDDLLQFINSWFDMIFPFEVHRGFHFQIRICKDRYEKLSGEAKTCLTELSLIHCRNVNDGTGVYVEGSEELRLWQEEHFWSNCNAYIFDFDSGDSYVLKARCEYGEEGLEESVDIVFFDASSFPPLVSQNINANESQDNFKEIVSDEEERAT